MSRRRPDLEPDASRPDRRDHGFGHDGENDEDAHQDDPFDQARNRRHHEVDTLGTWP